MAFRATNEIPSRAYSNAKARASRLRQFALDEIAAYSGGASAERILSLIAILRSSRDELSDFRSVPGIADIAQTEENDPTYNAAAEFNAVIAAVDAALTDIVAVLPRANGKVTVFDVTVSGTDWDSFTSQQLTGAGVISRLQTIADAIS